MEYIVEVHDRPIIQSYHWVECSEPTLDFWFIINVNEGQPVFKAMQDKALEIANSKYNGNYKTGDLVVLNRTADRFKISRESLEELRKGEVLSKLLTVWKSNKYIR